MVQRPEEGRAQLVQRPVYYLSEVLSSSKQNYPHYQKMCYGVYFAAKKPKPYFQEHPITVVCTAPLSEPMISDSGAVHTTVMGWSWKASSALSFHSNGFVFFIS